MATTTALSPIAQRLRRIQQKLGVTADGMLGPQTLSALETRLEVAPAARAFSLEVSVFSLDTLVNFEVSSARIYEQRYRRPAWPGGSSGVTIGIGYDLGNTPKAQIRSDWEGWVADADLNRLLTTQGVKGAPARTLARSLSDISIPFDVAQTVFHQSTLPRFARMTRSTYPGVQKLPADAQGMLLSLIYNRGTSLSGARRAEMAAIRPLVSRGAAALDAIADQIARMARLWPDTPGLQQRRRTEARIICCAAHPYATDELIRV
ncbi:MAG TPA: hypothetical protein VFR96_14475 [Povalibacter sp.]|nr:hypothetical protein [Povalibacter sp.]